MRSCALAAVLISTVIGIYGQAFAETELKLSTQDWRQIKKIELALNELKTLRSSFIQTRNASGYEKTLETGQLYLERPGKIRVAYDAPSVMLIVANHGEFIIANQRSQETARYPLSQTPLALLLDEKISFQHPDLHLNAFLVQEGFAELTLSQRENPEAGALTLRFTQDPIQLRQWRIIDAAGEETVVTLQDPVINTQFDPNLFKLPRY